VSAHRLSRNTALNILIIFACPCVTYLCRIQAAVASPKLIHQIAVYLLIDGSGLWPAAVDIL
jgi:hypothetical protein